MIPSLEFAGEFVQEPCAAFRLVNPNLNQAAGGDVLVLLTDLVGLAQKSRQLRIVVSQLRQHPRRCGILVVVLEALVP